jgi:hypothetical protein
VTLAAASTASGSAIVTPAIVPKMAMSMVSSAGHSSASNLAKSGGIARRRMSAMPWMPVTRSCGRA